ncbi:MAG: hypothetical protein WCK34_08060 [Bacteroidota bacterium]
MKTTIKILILLMGMAPAIHYANGSGHCNGKPITTEFSKTIQNAPQETPLLFADNDGTEAAPGFEVAVSKLAPVTPAEAEFEDIPDASPVDISALAPSTPAAADFEQPGASGNPAYPLFAPIPPAEADFTE